MKRLMAPLINAISPPICQVYNSDMTARVRIAADLAAICKRLDDGDPRPGDEEQLRVYKEMPAPVRAQVMRAAEMIYPLAAPRLRDPEEPADAIDNARLLLGHGAFSRARGALRVE